MTMSPERWEQIQEIFQLALEVESDRRAAFIKEACWNDPTMLTEIESLITAFYQASQLEQTPISNVAALLAEQNTFTIVGKQIGPYKIIKEIGQGGMGSVYLAERIDDQYQKQVAIKVVISGLYDKKVHQRFFNERQALAELEHPNIAKLIDGGTTDEGLPYLIMDYIEGVTIEEYCNQRKLSITDRLKLFRIICSAVSYAHQKGIVHRDIKPSNVLITMDGTAKLLDFGIAKFLNTELSVKFKKLTDVNTMPMTPEFASPEQFRNESITPASDIYSLGVLLYTLLTGHSPYRLKKQTLLEIKEAVCDKEPLKPSQVINTIEKVFDGTGITSVEVTPEQVSEVREGYPEKLRRRLQGDLDNIILKALHKEPEYRYNSVEQFSEDIRRHLEGFPVIAHKSTFRYRANKFIKRNKVGLLATATVLLTLLGGIVSTSYQARVAEQKRNLAIRTANTMINELAGGLEKMTGPTEGRLGLLKQASKVFDEIANENNVSPELNRLDIDANITLSKTYLILGDLDNALVRGVRAEQKARDLVKTSDASVPNKVALAASLLQLGDIYSAKKDAKHANDAYEQSLLIYKPISFDLLKEFDSLLNYAVLLARKGDRYYNEGNLSEAENYYQQGLQIENALIQKKPNNADYQRVYATSLESLGAILYATGKLEASREPYVKALEIRRHLANVEPNNPIILANLAIAIQNVSWYEEQAGNIDKALALYNESVDIQKKLLYGDPSNTIFASNLMGGLGTIGNTFLSSKKEVTTAIKWYREAFAVGISFREKGKNNAGLDASTATMAQILANALIDHKDFTEATNILAVSNKILNELIAKDPQNTDYQRSLVYTISSQGDICQAEHKFIDALNYYQSALVMCQKVIAVSDTSENKQLASYCYYKLGNAYKRLSQTEQARQMLLTGKDILLQLRQKGELSDSSDGYREYLPKINQELGEKL